MPNSTSAAIKVGLFTLLSLGVLFGAVYWLQSRKFKDGPAYTVSFNDVDGLREGAPVQLMGTRVGFIEEINPEQDGRSYRVRVKFRLTNEKHPVPEASVLSIEQSGLISEKMLEITPPQLQPADVETRGYPLKGVKPPLALELRMESGWHPVGQVEKIERLETPPQTPLFEKRTYQGYRLYYRVTRAGVLLPDVPYFFLKFSKQGKPILRVDSYDPDWKPPQLPDRNHYFTVESPLRLKEFLEIQIASAEALKETNDKLNALLDAKTIASIQAIVQNVQTLSGQTTDLVDSTQNLLNTVNKDVQAISGSLTTLSASVNRLIYNINSLVEDPELKGEVKGLVADLRQTVLQAQALLEDPELKNTLNNANRTLENVNEVAVLAQAKLESETITKKMETTLSELNILLEKANAATGGEDPAINQERLRSMVKDAVVTLHNLKQFSQKLRGHFILWKLLF